MSYTGRYFLLSAILVGATLAEVHAQGMKEMPGMGGSKQETTASATGTVIAIDAAGRKITLNHGPLAEIKWPAMKMEFAVVPSVDLSKVRLGDKVRFTVSGSGALGLTAPAILQY